MPNLFQIALIMCIVGIPSVKGVSFYENSVEDSSFSIGNTTQTLIQYSMCMSTRPVVVYVTARPVDASMPHKFKASVVNINHDSAMVELTRIDANKGWNWMALEIKWIVYMSGNEEGDWHELGNGYSYKMLDTALNHANARRACKDLGAWLVVHAEKDQIMIRKLRAEYTALAEKPYWIGMTRVGRENKWIWDDWTPLTTSVWNSGESNGIGTNENCVSNGRWNTLSPLYYWFDQQCKLKSFYPLCERPTLPE